MQIDNLLVMLVILVLVPFGTLYFLHKIDRVAKQVITHAMLAQSELAMIVSTSTHKTKIYWSTISLNILLSLLALLLGWFFPHSIILTFILIAAIIVTHLTLVECWLELYYYTELLVILKQRSADTVEQDKT